MINTYDEAFNNDDYVVGYLNLNDAEDFDLVRHNKGDHENYRTMKKISDERADKIVRRMQKQERLRLLKLWDDSLPERWSGATLKKMKMNAAVKVREIIQNSRKPVNFYVNGEHGAGKTYLSYAIMRTYVQLGYVHPNAVKFVSEEDILGMARSGFNGQNDLKELTHSKMKGYIFDSVSSREHYEPKEIVFLEQFIEHIYNNNLIVIFNGNTSAASWVEKFDGSINSKLRYLIDGNTVTMDGGGPPELNDWTEKELKSLENEVSVFDSFK